MYIGVNLHQVYFSVLWLGHALETTFFIIQITVLAYTKTFCFVKHKINFFFPNLKAQKERIYHEFSRSIQLFLIKRQMLIFYSKFS